MALLLLFGSNLYADAVTIAWDANTEPDLAGYKLYWGPDDGGPYPNEFDVGDVLTAIIDIPLDTYIVATAYDNEDPVNESGFSNQVLYAQVGDILPATGGMITTVYIPPVEENYLQPGKDYEAIFNNGWEIHYRIVLEPDDIITMEF